MMIVQRRWVVYICLKSLISVQMLNYLILDNKELSEAAADYPM